MIRSVNLTSLLCSSSRLIKNARNGIGSLATWHGSVSDEALLWPLANERGALSRAARYHSSHVSFRSFVYTCTHYARLIRHVRSGTDSSPSRTRQLPAAFNTFAIDPRGRDSSPRFQLSPLIARVHASLATDADSTTIQPGTNCPRLDAKRVHLGSRKFT